ncbi:MAG: hypothetical protein FK730_00065, partial [Asgard group archaeon]|nr:hypothetical protein [Asgard group archaeon]
MKPEEKVEVIVMEKSDEKSRFSLLREKIGLESRSLQNEFLRGHALRIYWYLLTHPNGIAGVREIQRDLDFASPSSVSYQINKLLLAGVVAKNEDSEKYYIKEEIKSGILGYYFRLGYRVIPRFTIYLIIYLIGLSC